MFNLVISTSTLYVHVDEPDDEAGPAAIASQLNDHATPMIRVIAGN